MPVYVEGNQRSRAAVILIPQWREKNLRLFLSVRHKTKSEMFRFAQHDRAGDIRPLRGSRT